MLGARQAQRPHVGREVNRGGQLHQRHVVAVEGLVLRVLDDALDAHLLAAGLGLGEVHRPHHHIQVGQSDVLAGDRHVTGERSHTH